MSNLKNGDLIMIKLEGKEVKAKYLKENGDGNKIQVFAGGKLQWVPIEDYTGPAQPLDLSNNTKAEVKKATDKVVASAEGKGEGDKKEENNPKKDSRESKTKAKADKKAKKGAESGQEQSSPVAAAQNEGEAESASNEPEIELTKTQATVLEHLIGKGIDVSEELNELSLATGLLNPQIEIAAMELVTAGLITREENQETGIRYKITQNALDMKKKSPKNRAAVKKMKPAAKGEAALSKRDQVIALLKDKALTVNDIAEKLDTDPNYVREIKTSINKKVDEPEAGSVKAKIWKLLKDGKTAKEVAEKVEKSSVYVYKIQKQMVSAGVL